MSRRFEDKVSLITGSSRGIGRALALTLAREGASIVVNYIRNAELAAETVREIEALGSRAIAVQANVENVEEIDRLFDRVARRVRPPRSLRLQRRRQLVQKNRATSKRITSTGRST